MNKKILSIISLLFFFFILIGSVSAANFYVNTNTNHKDINDWLTKSAKTGDSLIFNSKTYKLKNTLVINKSINIKSYKNTKIIFSKYNSEMFGIKANNVNFYGLNLHHNGRGNINSYETKGVISSQMNSKKRVNLFKTNIYTYQNYVSGINIKKWEGKINKCKISNKGKYLSYGVISEECKVSIYNSKINTKTTSLFLAKWRGNIQNTAILSQNDKTIHSTNWKGILKNNKFYSYGKNKYKKFDKFSNANTVNLGLSKGLISNCILKSKYGCPILTTNNVKIINSKLFSGNGIPKIYRYKPDLIVNTAKFKGNTLNIDVRNTGYAASNNCSLSLEITSKELVSFMKKIIPVKSLNPKSTTMIEIIVPLEYTSDNYIKWIRVDCYDVIEEESEHFNLFRFPLPDD